MSWSHLIHISASCYSSQASLNDLKGKCWLQKLASKQLYPLASFFPKCKRTTKCYESKKLFEHRARSTSFSNFFAINELTVKFCKYSLCSKNNITWSQQGYMWPWNAVISQYCLPFSENIRNLWRSLQSWWRKIEKIHFPAMRNSSKKGLKGFSKSRNPPGYKRRLQQVLLSFHNRAQEDKNR